MGFFVSITQLITQHEMQLGVDEAVSDFNVNKLKLKEANGN